MSLKEFCTFWRTLHIPLISFEVNLIITWSQGSVFTAMVTQDAVFEHAENRARRTIK